MPASDWSSEAGGRKHTQQIKGVVYLFMVAKPGRIVNELYQMQSSLAGWGAVLSCLRKKTTGIATESLKTCEWHGDGV